MRKLLAKLGIWHDWRLIKAKQAEWVVEEPLLYGTQIGTYNTYCLYEVYVCRITGEIRFDKSGDSPKKHSMYEAMCKYVIGIQDQIERIGVDEFFRLRSETLWQENNSITFH